MCPSARRNHREFGGHSLFDDIVVHNLEDGSNTQNQIISTDKLCQSVLVHNVVNMYVHDYCDNEWLFPAMPAEYDSWSQAHPELFQGFKSAIKDSNNPIVSFIQTGYFAKFWTEADKKAHTGKSMLNCLLYSFRLHFSIRMGA